MPYLIDVDETDYRVRSPEVLAQLRRDLAEVINVVNYGTVGDGIVDDTAAIQAAIDDAPDFAQIVIPAGTYRVDGTIVNNGKSLHISAYGATFVRDVAGTVVAFTGAYDPTVAVSALTWGVIDSSNYGVTLTVAGTMPWKRGDIVKVFADNVLPETLVDVTPPAASTARSGQFFTVWSVSANQVKLLGELIDPLTTNIRAARMQDISCVWEGGTFTVTDNYVASSFTGGGVTFSTMRRPVIRDVRNTRSGSSAFGMVGNFGYLVENCEVDWAQDDSANSHYGYGVTDTVSSFGVVIGCRFFQPRHGYTTNYSSTTAGQDLPRAYGRTFGAKIIGCLADSSSNSGFDTHSDGEQIQFIDCTVLNAPQGFHLRGRRNRVINGTVKRSDIAVRLPSDSENGESYGHTVDGLKCSNVKTVLQVVTHHGGGNPLAGVRDTRTSTIRNVDARGVTVEGFDMLNTTVDADNVFIEYAGPFSSAMPLNSLKNSELIAGRVRMDFAGASGSGANLFDVDGGTLEIESLRMTGPVGMGTVLGRAINIVAGGPTVRVGILADYAPGTEFVNGVVGSNSWVSWATAVGVNGKSSAWTALTDATVQAAIIQAVTRRRDPVITLEFTLPATQVLANLPNAQQGQVLILQNSSAAGRNITVNHGTTPNTNLSGGTSKTIQPGQSLVLVYGNNIWNHRTFV